MARILNPSDIFLIRSDRHAKCVVCGPAQTPPPARAWPAPNRANSARFTDRDLQALWPAELPLHRRTWARPQAISVHSQANRRTPAAWLRAECNPRPGRRVPRPGVGDRDNGFPLPHGRGDEFHHGSPGIDPRSLPSKGLKPRDIYVPDLHIDSIKVKSRDFR